MYFYQNKILSTRLSSIKWKYSLQIWNVLKVNVISTMPMKKTYSLENYYIIIIFTRSQGGFSSNSSTILVLDKYIYDLKVIFL